MNDLSQRSVAQDALELQSRSFEVVEVVHAGAKAGGTRPHRGWRGTLLRSAQTASRRIRDIPPPKRASTAQDASRAAWQCEARRVARCPASQSRSVCHAARRNRVASCSAISGSRSQTATTSARPVARTCSTWPSAIFPQPTMPTLNTGAPSPFVRNRSTDCAAPPRTAVATAGELHRRDEERPVQSEQKGRQSQQRRQSPAGLAGAEQQPRTRVGCPLARARTSATRRSRSAKQARGRERNQQQMRREPAQDLVRDVCEACAPRSPQQVLGMTHQRLEVADTDPDPTQVLLTDAVGRVFFGPRGWLVDQTMPGRGDVHRHTEVVADRVAPKRAPQTAANRVDRAVGAEESADAGLEELEKTARCASTGCPGCCRATGTKTQLAAHAADARVVERADEPQQRTALEAACWRRRKRGSARSSAPPGR